MISRDEHKTIDQVRPHRSILKQSRQMLMEVTTQQFKKYTTIQVSDEARRFMESGSQPKPIIQISFQNTKSTPNKQSHQKRLNFYQKYVSTSNHKIHQKKQEKPFKSLIHNTIANDVIAIDDRSQQSVDLNDERRSRDIDRNQVKKSRSHSLKAYLDRKRSQMSEKELFLPKIGRQQNIIEMIEKEFRQNKERKIKNPKLKSLKLLPQDHIIDKSMQDHHILLNQNQSLKNSKVMQNDSKRTQSLQEPQLLPRPKKRRIELLGMKLRPLQRQNENKIAKFMQQRIERVSHSHNLLSSQLIYNNPKESIEKSVYQQLIKRLFSSN